jgi:predicted transposase/invertase (TIGR01784 family)
MGHTVTIIKHLSADERMRLAIEDREKAMRDRISLVEDSKLEGRIEGRAEGRVEGKIEGKRERELEMVKKMLSLGVALDVISEASGLPAEEITALGEQ